MALGLLITLLVLVVAAYGWYNFTGWKAFAFAGTIPFDATAGVPSWGPAPGRTVAHLRFRNAVFTVTAPDGARHVADVTAALNGMAVAYVGAQTPPATLALDSPLNAFSFAVAGINTGNMSADEAKRWAQSATSLVGSVRTI
jgi:hypothetical protein